MANDISPLLEAIPVGGSFELRFLLLQLRYGLRRGFLDELAIDESKVLKDAIVAELTKRKKAGDKQLMDWMG